jgi:hypothetical protein
VDIIASQLGVSEEKSQSAVHNHSPPGLAGLVNDPILHVRQNVNLPVT